MAELTDQQARFVDFLVSTGSNATASAIHAGYAVDSAKQSGFRLLGKPHVQEAIRAAQIRELAGPMASKALSVIADILNSEKVSPAIKLDAAKAVLDRGGFSARVSPGSADPARDRPQSEWTMEELERFISKGKEEIAVMRKQGPQTEPAALLALEPA